MKNLVFPYILISVALAGKSAKECTWNGTVSELEENCTKITGKSIILGADNDLDMLYTKLAWVEEVQGCLQLSGTEFIRLDFFARLRNVSCSNSSVADFSITNNTALERLGMPFLKVSRMRLTGNPLLCLTQNEENRYKNVQLDNSYNFTLCEGINGTLKECSSVANSTNGGLDDNCEIILGNLYIEGSKNNKISKKMEYVKEINGRIYIRSTDLNNLTIPLLEKVYAGESKSSSKLDPTIYISNNSNFTKLDVPKINFMSMNDYSFMCTDSEYDMDQDLINRLAQFGTVMRFQISSLKYACLKLEKDRFNNVYLYMYLNASDLNQALAIADDRFKNLCLIIVFTIVLSICGAKLEIQNDQLIENDIYNRFYEHM